MLNLSAAGAAVAVRNLVRQGSLLQAGQAPSQGGRPASKLLVAPELAMAFSHVVCSLGLKSALVNVGGDVLTSTCSRVESAVEIPQKIAEVETRLSESQNGVPLVGSALVLPGSPHPANRKLGKAPWLFGGHEIDVSETYQIVLTNAMALFRAQAASRPELTRDLTLAIDLNDGASAVLGTPEGSRVLLNLMGMCISESGICAAALCRSRKRFGWPA